MMHTGIISFCDRVRYNIKSSDAKDMILASLEGNYGIRILQKHWYRLDESTSLQLRKTPHWACLRSNGNPYYMYLTRLDDVNIIYFIDKKVQPGYEKPRIILGRGRFDDKLFDGTVLDGEMVRRTDGPGWIFLVNDMIACCGEYFRDAPLSERLEHAYTMFRTMYKADPLFDVCTYLIKKYVPATSIDVARLVDLSTTLPYTNRGIYMWSHNMRIKPKLFNFDEGLIRSVHRKVKDCPDFRDRTEVIENHEQNSCKKESSSPVAQYAKTSSQEDKPVSMELECTNGEKVFWLRKTENPDVYDIFTTQQCMERVGNAYISSLATSKKLRSVFKDITVAMGIPFVCAYNTQFEKWCPLRRLDIVP